MDNFKLKNNLDVIPSTPTTTSQGVNVLPDISMIIPYGAPVIQRLSNSTAYTISGVLPSTPATGFVRYSTSTANDFTVGDTVVITGLTQGTPSGGFSGTFIIAGIISSTQFYVYNETTGTPTSTSPSVYAKASSTVPSGWLLCDGQTFSSSTYPLLYAALGNSNTLPDLRGKYLAGYNTTYPLKSSSNTSTHSHAGSASGTVGGWTPLTHGHSYNALVSDNSGSLGSHNHAYSGSFSVAASGGANSTTGTGTVNAIGNHSHGTITGNIGQSGSSTNASGSVHSHNVDYSDNTASDPNFTANSHNHTTTMTVSTSSTTWKPLTFLINYLIKADI